MYKPSRSSPQPIPKIAPPRFDGWADLLTIGFPGKACHWYENPREGGGHFTEHLVIGARSEGEVDESWPCDLTVGDDL